MMKTICCLGSAALGVALLSACGSTTPVAVDKSKLSNGDGNQVSTGGYVWTYTDHNKTPTDAPDETKPETWDYHATISPLTNKDTAFVTTVDDDKAHGNVFKITGDIPLEMPWTDFVADQVAASVDTYWPVTHAEGAAPPYTDAMVPAYPAAGMGFGFQADNVPYDATQNGKYVGIAFDMKVNTHMELVWVSIPTEDTDLPDPANGDKFTKKCDYYTTTNQPAGGASSCFTNYRKGIFNKTSIAGVGGPYNTLADEGKWQRYCVLYSEVGIPGWASPEVITKMKGIGFDPTHALKVQWDMYQPKGNFGTPKSHFDVSIDNMALVTEAQAKDAANNCNQGHLGMEYGTGDAGH